MICIDGLIKPDAPGSLRQPAKTTLLPDNWATVPLSFGLIMCNTTLTFTSELHQMTDAHLAPWGGHGVFPNIYRDMRRPQKYGGSLWATYIFTVRRDFRLLMLCGCIDYVITSFCWIARWQLWDGSCLETQF